MPSGTLDELQAFIAVVEAGGFTAAARRLSLTTNAVSLRVQKLEAALGVKLFVRTTRSVTTTEAGRAYFERVSILLAELEAAEADIRPTSEGLRGTVRIGLPGSIVTAPFFERLRQLLEAHPALCVQMRVVNTPLNLAAEGLDIALVVGQLPQSTFVGKLLGRSSWVLAASPAYLDKHGRPKTPAQLAAHRCLRFLSNPPQTAWTLVDRHGAQISVRVGGGYEADDTRTLGEATYAGLGIGVRSLGECKRAMKERQLERVLPAYRFQSLDVSALVTRAGGRLPRVAACLEALRAAVQELA
jgi:DNA-binding transcriptional LysR family regulator